MTLLWTAVRDRRGPTTLVAPVYKSSTLLDSWLAVSPTVEELRPMSAMVFPLYSNTSSSSSM